jgi:hypothetical protein
MLVFLLSAMSLRGADIQVRSFRPETSICRSAYVALWRFIVVDDVNLLI